MNVCRRWLNSAVNWSVACINLALVLLAVVSRNSTSAGIFAVALVQATSMTYVLNFLIMSLVRRAPPWYFPPQTLIERSLQVEAEICIVAVERIKEYADLAPEEQFLITGSGKDAEEDEKDGFGEEKAFREVWPQWG